MGKSSNKKKKAAVVSSRKEDNAGSSNEKRRDFSPNYGGKVNYSNIRYGIASAASLITFIVYLTSLHNGFVSWDDNLYVYDNPHIRSFNAAFFRWAFLEFHAANWHPLTWISHALDYAVWGLNPLGHHLTNNILHALNTFFVVILSTTLVEACNRKAERSRPQLFLYGPVSLIAGGITGLLFGIHPVHVESVAWVSERKDLLCALFYLIAIIQYAKYANVRDVETIQGKPNIRFLNKSYLLVVAFFSLALLSKPMAVSLPVVLLILDWYPLERIRSVKSFLPALVEKLPLFFLTIIASILTVLAQKSGGAIKYIDVIPFSTRASVAAKSITVYLWKMALPLNLVPFYPYPENISPWYFLFIILVFGITATCIVIAKRQKLWLSVWGYYVVTLIPVLGIVQVGGQSMADRYTYLPSLGPFLIAGFLFAWGIERTIIRQRQSLNAKLVGGIIIILVSGCLSFLTLKQVAIWKDSIALWTYVIEREPQGVPIAHYNLGLVYQNRNMPDKALEQYLIATRLAPDDADAHNNLGLVYKRLNMPDKAMEQYLIASKLNPDNAETHSNLGISFQLLNMPDKAEEEFLAAAKLRPDDPKFHFNLGVFYKSRNMINKAREHYMIALKLMPDYAEAHYNLGNIYLSLNMLDNAEAEFQTTLKLMPDFAEAHYNLGFVYYNRGQMEKAQGELAKGLEIQPTNQPAQQLFKIITARLKTKD